MADKFLESMAQGFGNIYIPRLRKAQDEKRTEKRYQRDMELSNKILTGSNLVKTGATQDSMGRIRFQWATPEKVRNDKIMEDLRVRGAQARTSLLEERVKQIGVGSGTDLKKQSSDKVSNALTGVRKAISEGRIRGRKSVADFLINEINSGRLSQEEAGSVRDQLLSGGSFLGR